MTSLFIQVPAFEEADVLAIWTAEILLIGTYAHWRFGQ
jgi:hypothetical protein